MTMNEDERAFLASADAYIEDVWEDVVADITRLVAVPSAVNWDEATPESPSGPAAHEGLRMAVRIAQDLGFDAVDEAGEIGYADLPGAGSKQVAMICHADVVPAGIGWTGDPWQVRRKEGFLLGRGVIDDKGPLVVSLYCMKYFADKGITLPYDLRMIMGTNEEMGSMRDVRYYLDHHAAPDFLFTPDANFPVGYGEKGNFHGEVWSAPLGEGRIVDFNTGENATNAVPGQATLVLAGAPADLPADPRIAESRDGQGLVTLVATGKGGHASLPEGTVNAIGILVEYALANQLVSPAEAAFLGLCGRIIASTDGSSIGIATADEDFGPLTCIAGTIRKRDDQLILTVDSRFPTTQTAAGLAGAFTDLAATVGGSFVVTLGEEPFLIDAESPLVQALASAYRDATGFDGEPFTMGGGTYAREFPCAASFGPEDPHDHYPDWVGGMHGPDEGVSEASLKRAMRTYLLTLHRLAGLDLDQLLG